MSFFGKIALVGAVTAAAVGYYAKRKHDETGAGYGEVLLGLPGEVQRFAGELGERSRRALDEGLLAARTREAELELLLESGGRQS